MIYLILSVNYLTIDSKFISPSDRACSRFNRNSSLCTQFKCVYLSSIHECHSASKPSTIDRFYAKYKNEPDNYKNQIQYSISSANDLLSGVRRDLNLCYATYSDNGCPTCHSRDSRITCGWCQSQGFCAEGSRSGPSFTKCPSQDWIFNQTQCNSDMCSTSHSQNTCRSPCSWSSVLNICFAPFIPIGFVDGVMNAVENVIIKSNVWIIAVAVLFVVVLIITVVGLVLKARHRSHYQSLPLMKKSVTLNDIPKL